MTLHPPPLSESVVSGSTYVLLASGRQVRISELAARYPMTHAHKLRTPVGDRLISIRLGGFQSECRAIRLLDSRNKSHLYKTDAPIYVQEGLGFRPYEPVPYVFNAFRMVDGEPVYGPLTYDKEVVRRFEHYSYTLTPGPVYLGDGLPITYLPFHIQ